MWIELSWGEPQTIGAARIVSGYNYGGRIGSPLRDFRLEHFEQGIFREIPGTAVEANDRIQWHARFGPVTTRRVRLFIRRTDNDIARIWELELYDPSTPTMPR